MLSVFFFFQAEDGIRDFHVTGVLTCALPISAIVGIGGVDQRDAGCQRLVDHPTRRREIEAAAEIVAAQADDRDREVRLPDPALLHQSTLRPVRAITSFHIATSAAMRACNASGPLPTGLKPELRSLSRRSGRRNVSAVSLASRSTISL